MALYFAHFASALVLAFSCLAADTDVMSTPSSQFPLQIPAPPSEQHQFQKWFRTYWPDSTLHAFLHRKQIVYVVLSPVFHGEDRFDSQHVIWISAKQGKVLGYQEHYLNSCWRPISGEFESWKNGVLSWGAEGMFKVGDNLEDQGYEGFFDSKEPEKGLQIRKTYSLPIKR